MCLYTNGLICIHQFHINFITHMCISYVPVCILYSPMCIMYLSMCISKGTIHFSHEAMSMCTAYKPQRHFNQPCSNKSTLYYESCILIRYLNLLGATKNLQQTAFSDFVPALANQIKLDMTEEHEALNSLLTCVVC